MGIAKHIAATKKGKGNGRFYGARFLFQRMLELRAEERSPRRGSRWFSSVADAVRGGGI